MSGNSVPVEKLARAIIFENESGFMFCTHEGDLVGPHEDREDAVVKATLYLSAYKERKNDN